MQSNILDEVPFNDLKKAYSSLEKKNKDLIDSLYYAAFVQQGLMPQKRHFEKLETPYFVYYNPQHIIGGDFFWIGKKDYWNIMVVGDCTGHGVSGAMLSTLALGFLNYVVFSKSYSNVGEILNEIDKKWFETFQYNADATAYNNDWIEMSIVAYNTQTKELQFSGAMGSILLHDCNGLRKIAGNSFPLGGWQIEDKRVYSTQFFKVEKGTKLYLYSDGYKDQFGGYKNKRMGARRFFDFITELAKIPMHIQKVIVEKNYMQWRGAEEQTDDICLMGIEF